MSNTEAQFWLNRKWLFSTSWLFHTPIHFCIMETNPGHTHTLLKTMQKLQHYNMSSLSLSLSASHFNTVQNFKSQFLILKEKEHRFFCKSSFHRLKEVWDFYKACHISVLLYKASHRCRQDYVTKRYVHNPNVCRFSWRQFSLKAADTQEKWKLLTIPSS